jgi:hypothetical protein
MSDRRDPDPDTVSDSGLEGGVDEPNEDGPDDADAPEGGQGL